MNASQLKDKYLSFFKSQKHQEIPSAGLTPENDPTTLFISAGMHPLVPFLLGQPHPLGKRLVNVQKCVRTGDIDEVGDTYHHTFFEMLGNWSLGDYFKKEAIQFSYQFLTKHLNLDPQNIFVTCFAGNQHAPKDELSASVWQSLGISQDRIIFLPDNWWGPAGATGPCGPDTEMFIDTQPHLPPVDFKTGDKQGRYLEIWNNVFMEYQKNSDNTFTKLTQQNVDTGMGVERTIAALNGFSDNYQTSIWQPIIKKIEEISGKSYSDPEYLASFRIIADHIRAAVFIIADGVEPSNKEAGYVLRRLIRRSIRQGKILGLENNFIPQIGLSVLVNQKNYAGNYPELNQQQSQIIETLKNEENKFRRTLNKGLEKAKKEIENLYKIKNNNPTLFTPKLIGEKAFYLYESYGFPVEIFLEEPEFKTLIKILNKDDIIREFEKVQEEHIKKSQTLSSGKFKSGLADNSEIITRLHTATHLLHASLRKILGQHVHQAGSNITSQRLRFDFTHPDKLTQEQISEIEKMVNQQITQSLPVTFETMKFSQAQKLGALAFFGSKYPQIVTVYTVGDSKKPFSREVCTGPHVTNTKELLSFKIIKEESAGLGKRRLYASLN